MKKVLLSVIFGLITALSLCLSGNLNVRAYAEDSVELGLRVEKVTEKKTIDGYVVKVDDIKVTVTIINNPGFCSGSMTIRYPENLSPIINTEWDMPIYECGSAGDLMMMTAYHFDEPAVSFAYMGGKNEYDDGDIISFYFTSDKPATNLGTGFCLKVNTFKDYELNPVPIPDDACSKVWTAKTYTLLLGDIDGNGIVDSNDSQLLYQLLEMNGNMETTLTAIIFGGSGAYAGYSDISAFDGLFVIAFVDGQNQEFLALGVADVNGDGVVDATDMNQIFAYYAQSVVGKPYPQNPNIGTMVQIVVWVYQ